MRWRPGIALIGVAAIAFAGGWFLRSRKVTYPAFPEAGNLRAVSKPCPNIGSTLQDLQVFSEKTIRYSPAESPGDQVLSFQRRGATAKLLVLADSKQDDVIDAEATTYTLAWNSPAGWTVTDCSSAVRYQRDRP